MLETSDLLKTDSLQELKNTLRVDIDEISTKFHAFEEHSSILLEEIFSKFTKTVDTDIVVLQNTLIEYSALSYTIGQSVADAKAYLQLFEVLNYHPKSDKYSETDRKLLVKALTIRQNTLAAKLGSAEEKLDKRITIIQSILKSEIIRANQMEADGDQSTCSA